MGIQLSHWVFKPNAPLKEISWQLIRSNRWPHRGFKKLALISFALLNGCFNKANRWPTVVEQHNQRYFLGIRIHSKVPFLFRAFEVG